jgi:hypothetical protein
MDENGIGTDATIAQHIETIQERRYAEKQNVHFAPTTLGNISCVFSNIVPGLMRLRCGADIGLPSCGACPGRSEVAREGRLPLFVHTLTSDADGT